MILCNNSIKISSSIGEQSTQIIIFEEHTRELDLVIQFVVDKKKMNFLASYKMYYQIFNMFHKM